MPTYSYRCASCDYAFDQYQAFTDDSLTVCPNCGEPQLRKVFNSIGVTFNGAGFYHNDSGSGSSKPTAAPTTEKAAKPEKASVAKKDAPKADSGSASS